MSKEQELDAEGRRMLREEESVGRLATLELWLARVRRTVLDKSPIGEGD